MEPVKRFAICFVLICIVGALSYSNILDGSFVFDDRNVIVNNPNIRYVTDFQSIWNAARSEPSRFIGYLSFALNYHFHQLGVTGYHLTNLVIHLMTSCLVFCLVHMLLSLPQLNMVIFKKKNETKPKDKRGRRSPLPDALYEIRDVVEPKTGVALLAALVFVAHPVQTQAVSYITQRFASLATFFYLSSVCFYLKARLPLAINAQLKQMQNKITGKCPDVPWADQPSSRIKVTDEALKGEQCKEPRAQTTPLRFVTARGTPHTIRPAIPHRLLITILLYAGAIIFGLLGMFTKEIVVTLPVMILLVEYFLLRPEGQQIFCKKNVVLAICVLLFVCVIPSFFSFKVSSVLFSPRISESHRGDVLHLGTYLLTQMRVFVTFVRLLVLPVNQNVDYDFAMSHHIFEPATFLSLLFFVCGVLWAVKAKKKDRLLAFGLLWIYLTFSANLIPRRHVIFEHKLYLISIGFCLVLSLVIYRLTKNWKKMFAVGLPIVLVFCCLTFTRNKVWKNEIVLWHDVIRKSPEKARGYNNLGFAYFSREQYGRAEFYFRKCLERSPTFTNAYHNLGAIYSRKGNHSKALNHYEKFLEMRPNDEGVHVSIGNIYKEQEQYDNALEYYGKAIHLNPKHAQAYNNRGIVYDKKGQRELAIEDYTIAIKFDPYAPDAYNNRASAYGALGRHEAALRDFNKALELKPEYELVYFNRGKVYDVMGKYDLAIADYSKAVSLNKEFHEAYFNRGNSYSKTGRHDFAMADFEKVIAGDAKFGKAYVNLGNSYGRQGEYDLAIDYYNKALEIDPDNASAYFNRGVAYQAKGEREKGLGDIHKSQILRTPPIE
ncbi:MAG: tetratricopeptide repeat protein [Candidatus Omnitrophica bacterium]|nr:tetratricopeptide repeat protein [Candidatus Omnitrophota bacterium]